MGFGQILGQSNAVAFLKASIKNHRLSHCYLFIGPEGVGKKTTALALAQYLNCQNPTDDACEICPSCIKTKLMEHPDVSLIEPDGASIKLRQIETMAQQVYLRSFEGGYKIIIFDKVHLLTAEAANALLKTLEEPAENTIFLLLCENPALLPQTIISRSQIVHFQPLSPQIITDILSREGYADAKKIAPLAQGSLSYARTLAQDENAMAFRKKVYDFLKDLPHCDCADLLLWCTDFDKDRTKGLQFISLAQLWYHDLLLYALGKEEDIVNTDYLSSFPLYSLESLSAILQLLYTAENRLHQNAAVRLVLEVLLLKIQDFF